MVENNKIVEVGFLLENDLEYYEKILEKAGAEKTFVCETHDKYWTNKTFEELICLTENQIKNSCVRLRECLSFDTVHYIEGEPSFHFDNYVIFDKNLKTNSSARFLKVKNIEIQNFINRMETQNWYLVFDTFKRDYQYKIGEMQSRLQLQEIDNIGLVLYYDNPEYYNMSEKLQRIALIDELNSYGFNFDYSENGIDKLRTLLTGMTCTSQNQNA